MKRKSDQPRWKRSKSLPINLSLFGRHRLLQVPQFDGLILGGCDQDRLYWMEGQVTDCVKVAPQSELWVPGFPQSIFVVLRTDGFAVTCCAKRGRQYWVYVKWSQIVFFQSRSWKFPYHPLTSNVRLSTSFATVILASSPSPNSLETASSTRPRMKHFSDDARKVIGSLRQQAVSKQRQKNQKIQPRSWRHTNQ